MFRHLLRSWNIFFRHYIYIYIYIYFREWWLIWLRETGEDNSLDETFGKVGVAVPIVVKYGVCGDHTTIPMLYGLPKIHKPNTHLWPIISSISSATHKISRVIAKILTPFTWHSQPLTHHNHWRLNKIKDINIQNKTMNSLDITSLYTNIPIKKCHTLLVTHLRKIKFNSPLPINTLVNI